MLTSWIAAAIVTHTTGAQPLQYPQTRRVDQVDSYHGTEVADPYRWLEDDTSADDAVTDIHSVATMNVRENGGWKLASLSFTRLLQ